MDQPGGLPSWVLHVDVDAFFVQVEQQKDPSLQGLAVAVQQHQQIIAANAAAKAAGVLKYQSPAEARRLLRMVGGRVAHVHTETGGRVSYKPYRAASARLLHLLKSLTWAAVVEKASIDEAFILLAPAGPDAAAAGDEAPGILPQVAMRRAHEVQAAARKQLGLAVSVGAAPNRLLAKLASAAAKLAPAANGIRLVADQPAALQLLAQTPVRRLPGFGGKAAEAFERYGIGPATDLQRFSAAQMEQIFGLKPAAAAQLAQWCRGLDNTPVQERGPPKTLSVQMSLTPQLLQQHPSQGGPGAVSAPGGRPGVLEPLVVGKPDFRLRVRQLMTAMGLDLTLRVKEDAAEESRWPKTLAASVRVFGAGRDQAFTSRSAGFPSNTLAPGPHRHAPSQQQQQQQQQQREAGQRQQQTGQHEQPQQQPLDPLEEAVVQGLEQLVHAAAASFPPTATVVELRLAATKFQSAAAAAAVGPITRFLVAAPRRVAKQEPQVRLEQEMEQQQQQQQQIGHAEEEQQQQRQLSAAQQGQTAAPPARHAQQQTHHPPPQQEQQQQEQQQQPEQPPDDSVDLASVDIREQQFILSQLQRQRGGGGSAKRKPAGGAAPGAKQRKIFYFLK